MDEIQVRVKATGVVRTVTRKAYMAMGPKVYERLSPTEEQQSQMQGSPNSTGPQISRSVKAAGPVVNEKIPAEEVTEKIKREDNEMTFEPLQVKEAPAKVKAKPGPKPKSISSNSTSDEK